MEFETKVKVDPTRKEKVFTSFQIAEALRAAPDATLASMKKTADKCAKPVDPGMEITALLIGFIVCSEVEKLLGIDGKDGAYVDGATAPVEATQ